jgi:hypothetical protein
MDPEQQAQIALSADKQDNFLKGSRPMCQITSWLQGHGFKPL